MKSETNVPEVHKNAKNRGYDDRPIIIGRVEVSGSELAGYRE